MDPFGGMDDVIFLALLSSTVVLLVSSWFLLPEAALSVGSVSSAVDYL